MVTRFFYATTVKDGKEIPIRWEAVLCMPPLWDQAANRWVTNIWIGDGVLKVAEDVSTLKARMNEAAGQELFPVTPSTSAFLTAANTKRLR